MVDVPLDINQNPMSLEIKIRDTDKHFKSSKLHEDKVGKIANDVAAVLLKYSINRDHSLIRECVEAIINGRIKGQGEIQEIGCSIETQTPDSLLIQLESFE